jgi:hypothetical protein
VVWCQNVSVNIADKARLLAGVYRCLDPAGCSLRRNIQSGRVATVPWAYDASINFLEPADVMRTQYHMAGFRILEWMNYSNNAIEHYERTLSAPPKLSGRLIFGDDARTAAQFRNLIERRTICWRITAPREVPDAQPWGRKWSGYASGSPGSIQTIPKP